MPTFKIDGKEIPFEAGDSIIRAAARQGIEIPHYCWHPGLSVPANCRMCLVEILPAANQRAMMLDILAWDAAKNDYVPVQKPKLQPACQIPAAAGMEVKSDTSKHVAEARHGVQQFLLLNHPVDCPICDQAGECKLQDYWLEYQKTQKRRLDEPVHKPKAEVFGPTIVYDGERCVMCTRCIRFMDEVALDPVLDMRQRGNLNEIFVSPGRQLEGKYTFMVEHVCPVGALTTVDFRFKARVWFLKTANSVCQGCATGCNAYLDYDPRFNKAYRYRPRDNEQVNKYWMCDDGMLTYKRAHDARVTEPMLQGGRTVATVSALEAAKKLLEGAPKESLAVVFSAQHSLEDNWALRELAQLVGATRFYWSGLGDGYEDKILIHKDKNPNTVGVQKLKGDAQPFAKLAADVASGAVTHAIALGGPTPGDPASDADALRPLKLVTIAAHDGALVRAAGVVLPACSWAESGGSFVNAKGIRQLTEKALEPIGSSRPAWSQIAQLSLALGHEPTWGKMKDIRSRLVGAGNPSLMDVNDAGREHPQTPATTEAV
ncbi:MAG: 2Fe-2S iron-sulfur cluster-binding protein [Polyangiaceae bacterium]